MHTDSGIPFCRWAWAAWAYIRNAANIRLFVIGSWQVQYQLPVNIPVSAMQLFSIEAVLFLVLSVCVLTALRTVLRFGAAVVTIKFVLCWLEWPTSYNILTLVIRTPGHRIILNPSGLLGAILPEIKAITLGKNHFMINKHTRTFFFAPHTLSPEPFRSFWKSRLWYSERRKQSVMVLLYQR